MQINEDAVDGKPVVIGSSISGLLISLSLSRAGIDHVLVGGDKPACEPRLGESMNEVASPELWRLYSDEFKQYFYPKSHISLLNGDYASMIYLNDPNLSLEEKGAVFANDASSPLPKVLMHIDRGRFDPAMYDKALEQPQCQFVSKMVEGVEYDGDNDRVSRLTFCDGEQITNPRYVFDTTGHKGLVANPAGVGMQTVSSLQRVVWTHYESDSDRCPVNWWCRGTNLLRLNRENDGVDGISWMIPLGGKVSIGFSSEAEDYNNEEYDSERMITLLVEAYERRGVDIRSHFPRQQKVVDLKHRYFIRDRAYGANWLLAGGSFVQIWFPSSAGLWTATAAAGIAPDLIERPAEVGAYYEKVMRGLLGTHEHLEKMILNPVFKSDAEVYQFWSNWIAIIIRRRLEYVRIFSGDYLEPMRWPYRVKMMKSWLTRMFPRLRVLAFRRAIACEKIPELSTQATAFRDYFKPQAFWQKNRQEGLRRALLSRA